MNCVFVNEKKRQKVINFIRKHWLSTEMIIRGNIIDMTQVDGLVIFDNEEIIALLTYIIKHDICEIISLNSLVKKKGIGSLLIEKIIAIANQRHCKKIIVITTNDNINAIRFYQKRGFDMVKVYRNSLDDSRKLKSSIPLIGENNIPLQHEIEFEYNITK